MAKYRETYASCHILRLVASCWAIRSALDLGACDIGCWSWACLWAESITQSSSTKAPGFLLLAILNTVLL